MKVVRKECEVYKSCDNVPCGKTMNRCKPSYCYPYSSRNWSKCNMANLKSNNKTRNTKICKNESKCRLNKTNKKPRYSVSARTLHNKMPYIWRFLKPQTRKHMIELAQKPINKINIPAHVFDQPISKLPRNIRQKYKTYRKKYKTI